MTIRKVIQSYLAIVLASVFFVLNLKYNIAAGLDMEKVSDKSIDLASISFGFLLAVLALLIQGNNPALERIKKSGQFPHLIMLNKKAVLASGLLVVISFLYLGFKLDKTTIEYVKFDCNNLINSAFLGVLIYQLLVVFSFIDIFYFIIKQEV
jgi:hypothetical protein